jgi:hypothetical protein
MIYVIVGFSLRLFVIVVESFTEFPKYNRDLMDTFEIDVFGFTFHRQINNKMSINIDNDLDYKSKSSH